MPSSQWQNWYHDKSPTVLFSLLCALLLFQTARAIGHQSPVYGGDEYAYLIQGIFLEHTSTLYARDPLLQKITNPLYLWLISVSNRLFADASLAVRLYSALAYSAFVAAIALGLANRAGYARAIAATAILAVFPSSAYSAGVMPDVLFYCFAAAAALTFFIKSEQPHYAAYLSGGLIALAFLVKPHALSIIAATIVWGGIVFILSLRGNAALLKCSLLAAYFVAGLYFTLVLLSWPLTGLFSLDPRYPVGIVYSNMVPGTGSNPSILSVGIGMALAKPIGFLWYALGNAFSCLLVIWPLLFLIALHLKRERDATGTWLNHQAIMATWFATAALAAIGMTVLYTFVVGSVNAGEANRLHARYYAYIYAAAFIYALAVPRWDDLLSRTFALRGRHIAYRSTLVASWALLNLFGILWLTMYEVWFQDNTELFSIVATIAGLWKATQARSNWLGTICFLALPFALLLRSPVSWAVTATLTFVWFSTALLETTRIQHIHSAAIQFRIQTGQLVRTLLASTSPERILFIGNSRYGQTAHVMYGAQCLCQVRQTKGNDRITEKDIPQGVEYIFAVDDPGLDFKAERILQIPAGVLYRLANRITQ